MHEFSRLTAALWVVVALLAAACDKNAAAGTVTGTTPLPGIRYEAHIAAGGVAPPAMQIARPKGVRENSTAGANLFASMNCDGCHGGGAPGWVGPSLIDGRWRYGGADDEVFSSIYFGRPKGMPAYGGVIGADGVWALVAYLKAQSRPSVVPTTSYEGIERASHAALAPVPTSAPAQAPRGPAPAPQQMMAQYGCVACHAVDRKVTGPSFEDVAAKYRGQPDAESRLAEKVKNGGSGVWGSIPMPPNPQVPDADLHALVRWVLTQNHPAQELTTP
jgi:cytochrome c